MEYVRKHSLHWITRCSVSSSKGLNDGGLPNCEVAKDDVCISCASGYFLDPASNLCIGKHDTVQPLYR